MYMLVKNNEYTLIETEEEKLEFNKLILELELIKNQIDLLEKIKYQELNNNLKIIIKYKYYWIRSPNTWSASDRKNQSNYEILVDFVKHIFCKYLVPEQLFNLILSHSLIDDFFQLFICITQGYSLHKYIKYKNLNHFPFFFYSRKECNDFLKLFFDGKFFEKTNEFDDETIYHKLYSLCYYSLTLSNGGSKTLGQYIAFDLISYSLKKWTKKTNEILIVFTKWLCKIEKEIISYIEQYKTTLDKTEPYKLLLELGEIEDADPEIYEDILDPVCDYLYYCFSNDPNYSLKGRTFNSVQKQMEIWHRELNIKNYSQYPQTWDHSKEINNFEYEHEGKTYTITEILSAEELYQEGKELNHCVLNYIKKIHAENNEDKITIWSVKENGKRLLTLELRKYVNKRGSQNVLNQARGFKNRCINEKEDILLDKWLKFSDIKWIA